MSRVVMDAVDIKTDKKIYFTGHANATYMSDGTTVETNINQTNNRIDELSDLNIIAVTAGDGEDLAQEYVTLSEFTRNMDRLNELLDDILGDNML